MNLLIIWAQVQQSIVNVHDFERFHYFAGSALWFQCYLILPNIKTNFKLAIKKTMFVLKILV